MKEHEFTKGMNRIKTAMGLKVKFTDNMGDPTERFNIYYERLQHIPGPVWFKAVDHYIDTAERPQIPTIGKLKECAKPYWNVRQQDTKPMTHEETHQSWEKFEDFERYFKARGLWDYELSTDEHREIWDRKHRPYGGQMWCDACPEEAKVFHEETGIRPEDLGWLANLPSRKDPEDDDYDDIPF